MFNSIIYLSYYSLCQNVWPFSSFLKILSKVSTQFRCGFFSVNILMSGLWLIKVLIIKIWINVWKFLFNFSNCFNNLLIIANFVSEDRRIPYYYENVKNVKKIKSFRKDMRCQMTPKRIFFGATNFSPLENPGGMRVSMDLKYHCKQVQFIEIPSMHRFI